MRTCTFSTPMTKSNGRTRHTIKALDERLTVALSIASKSTRGFFSTQTLDRTGTRHVFITNGVISAHLSSSPGGTKHRSLVLNLQGPLPLFTWSPVERLSLLRPPLQSLVLSSPTSSPTHTHKHTGGGAQQHPLRALQRHDRWMVASGTEPSSQITVHIHTQLQPFKSQMANSWTSFENKQAKSCLLMPNASLYYLTAGSCF